MRSFWSDPYLWIHLAGFAALPLWLELCWLALAAGNPVLPFWLELCVVAAIGIVPIFWMQWQRPFYIFSLIGVALKPAQLTEDQRRLLTLFKSQRNRYLAIAPAIITFLALRQLYYLAPIAAPVTPFTAETRWLGLLVAAIAFLGVNLFLQVPVSVLSVMLTGESTFAATTPYPLEQIRSDFTSLGIPVNQILPPVIATPEPEPVLADANLGLTAPPAVERPVAESAAEIAVEAAAEAESAEEWFADSETPAAIPDGELERVADAALAEPIRTEEALDTDLWDADPAIAPEASMESEAVVAPEAISNFAGATVTEDVDNSEAIVDSEEPNHPEAEISAAAIADSAASTPAEPITDSAAPSTDSATTLPEATTQPEASTDDADSVETLNPDQVASAPIEAPASDSDPLPPTHQDPENPKE